MRLYASRLLCCVVAVATIAVAPRAVLAQSPPEPDTDPVELLQPAVDDIGAIPVEALADEPVAEDTRPRKAASRLVEEVIVTAQKREELLQDVPITIQAFSADALDVRGIDDPTDLELITPAMVYDHLVGYSLIYMRGVGTEVFLPNQEPSVATYLDGIYFPFAHGLAQEFTPIERVEVLKGPQGTLFGRNATGGAISVVSVQPQDEWGGSVTGGMGSFNSLRGKVYLTGPIFDSLSFSVAGLLSSEDPYYELSPRSPRDELANNNSKGYNLRLRWQPTDRFSALISAYHTAFDGTWTIITSQTDPTPLGIAVGALRTGPRETAFNEPGTIDAETDVLYGQLELNTDWFDVKLLGSGQEIVTDTRWDYDNGPAPVLFFYPVKQYSENQSAELQILSNETSPWAEHLQWIAGFYYFHSEGGFDPNAAGVLNFDSPGPLTSTLGGLRDLLTQAGIPLPAAPAVINVIGTIETDALAAFAQATWRPFQRLGVTLGARYQTEDRHLLKSQVGLATDGYRTDNQITLLDWVALSGDRPISNEDISPRVAIDFRLTETMLLYGSWSQAFKSGTINIQNIYTPPSQIDPEKTTAYELGLKGDLFDGSLRYALAGFWNVIDDVQTQVVSVASGGLISLVNAGEAEITGVEFDLTWQMFPQMLPGFVLTASGCFLDGEYTDFEDGPGFDELTGIAFGPSAVLPARDFAGHKTVRTPDFSGSLGLSYTFDAPGGNVELGSDVYYNTGYFFDTQNVTEQPEYYVLNARLSYWYEAWDLRVSAFGKNLTDELYYHNIFANDFGEAATGGPPPTYGLTVTWNF